MVADGVGFVLGRRARSNSRKPLLPSPFKPATKDKKRQRERQNESGGGSSKKEKKGKKQKGGARGERAGGMEVAVAPLPTEAERRLLRSELDKAQPLLQVMNLCAVLRKAPRKPRHSATEELNCSKFPTVHRQQHTPLRADCIALRWDTYPYKGVNSPRRR